MPTPRDVPSFRALLSIAAYWGAWLLLVSGLVHNRRNTSTLALLAWLVGGALLAAWFTWIKIHDDRQRRLRGDEDDDHDEDERASPATRFLSAVVLGTGGMGCLLGAALLPAMRGELAVWGLLAIVGGFYVLFFGKRGRGGDFD